MRQMHNGKNASMSDLNVEIFYTNSVNFKTDVVPKTRPANQPQSYTSYFDYGIMHVAVLT